MTSKEKLEEYKYKLTHNQELPLMKAVEAINSFIAEGKDILITDKYGVRCVSSKNVLVRIKLLPGGIKPTKGTEEAAAYDCYAAEDVIVGEKAKLIGLGFCLELPKGYHAEIVPRSSIGLKTRLRQPNNIGIIDSDYRGEVKAMYECRIGEHTIHAGDRICQMLIKKNEEVEFIEVDELSNTDRGVGGFGSTGR